ncbi:MAG: HlyD family efflux transporter periplasmic adaptor subunit [Stenomitos rutilans HA7619-LM2]|jgi:HlyD family secretion protein|nr:HlyD family efflux transporter periplasmic adaptor subunit [Stenomitos rutilans HA7619-LM2]
MPPTQTETGNDSNNGSRQTTGTQVQEKPQTSEPEQQQSPKPEIPPQKPWQKIPKPVRILGVIALVAGVGFGAYRLFFYHPDENGIFLSGRIEGYETDVSAKIGGRVANVAAREGDLVKPGQLLVELDDSDTRAQLQGAIARVRAAQERLQRTHQQLPVLQAQLAQASLTTQQSGQDSEGRVLESENSVAASRSQLAEAQENLILARAKQRRTSFLYGQGAVSAQQQDEDNASFGTAQARVAAAKQQVDSAQGRLKQAQATAQNPSIRATQELQVQKQIAQAQTDIAVSQQEYQDAKANQAQIQANLNYLVVKSPMEGDVITRSVEPGEVVAAGAPLLTLVNKNQLYLRGFVPEGQIGKVRIGQSAQVYLDAFPDRPLEATVSRIDPKASFTPENTYFKKDRVTQVFGVELTLKNSEGLAKQGMPADGRVLLPESDRKQSKILLPGALGFINSTITDLTHRTAFIPQFP